MTHAMVKGSNVQLETGSVRAVLYWVPQAQAPDIDASALLLGDDGAVRWDEDFVFYNQPQHPSGLVRHLPKARDGAGLLDTVEADLTGLDPSVARVLLAASADGGTFAGVRELRLLLYAGNDPARPLLQFDIAPETGAESAMICGELYRRGDSWKFRALGQGYESGLVGLATRFGVSVEDGDATAEAPTSGSGSEASPPRGAADAPASPVAAPEDATVPHLPGAPSGQQPGHPATPPPYPPTAPAVPAAAAARNGGRPAANTVPRPPGEPDFPEPDPVPAPVPEPHPQPEPGPAPPTPEPPPGPPPEPPQPPPGEPDGRAYPPPPQQPPATRPAYGYPQPAYGYPQPDPDFTLPPQGPQFVNG